MILLLRLIQTATQKCPDMVAIFTHSGWGWLLVLTAEGGAVSPRQGARTLTSQRR